MTENKKRKITPCYNTPFKIEININCNHLKKKLKLISECYKNRKTITSIRRDSLLNVEDMKYSIFAMAHDLPIDSMVTKIRNSMEEVYASFRMALHMSEVERKEALENLLTFKYYNETMIFIRHVNHVYKKVFISFNDMTNMLSLLFKGDCEEFKSLLFDFCTIVCSSSAPYYLAELNKLQSNLIKNNSRAEREMMNIILLKKQKELEEKENKTNGDIDYLKMLNSSDMTSYIVSFL